MSRIDSKLLARYPTRPPSRRITTSRPARRTSSERMRPQEEGEREPKPCSHACTQTHKSQPITTLKHQTPKPPDYPYNAGGYGLFRSFPLLSAPTRGVAASPSKTCPCAACSTLFAKTSISRHSHQHQYVGTAACSPLFAKTSISRHSHQHQYVGTYSVTRLISPLNQSGH